MDDLPQAVQPPPSFIPNLPPEERRRQVVLVASKSHFPMELVGPLEVFRVANFVLENAGHAEMGYDLEVVSSGPGTVHDMEGLKIVVDKPYDQLAGDIDTLVLAPMDFTPLYREPPADFLAWIREMSGSVRRLASVCSATYLLAEAGVLDGRRATTHWDMCADFACRYPKVNLDEAPIYVKDGHIYSSAGMSAGLDLMLALVEEDFGRAVSLRTAQTLVLFLKRPANQAQFSTLLSCEGSGVDVFGELQTHIYEHPGEDLRVEKLAARVGMSPRNFSRAFTREVGLPPGRYVERCRLEIARLNLEETTLPLSSIAQRCGYGSPDSMRLAFERHMGVTPRQYRRRFASAAA